MRLANLKTNNGSAGFTIIELLIATAVFAFVLVLAQTGFLQIGNLFYRGVSISTTQETAQHIFLDINGNFQNAQSIVAGANSGYTYYCIGNTRYTYRLNNEIDTSAGVNHSASGNFGILKDNLPGSGSSCAPPCDDNGGCAADLKNSTELLGDKMRVEQFDITPSTLTSNLYNVSIILAYGDDDTLTYGTSGDFSTVSCQGDLHNSFCAVSRINTSVYKGLHQ